MRQILFALFVLFSVNLFSQTVTVIDRITRQPLQGVGIIGFPSNKTVTTSSKGQADITVLAGSDSLKVSYLGYATMLIGYKELADKKFILELQETEIMLGDIIVSANRWEESELEAPNRIEKIRLKEVQLHNPQTTADLLETSGFAFIQKSQQAGGSPNLRGFSTNRVMLVVDGVRMNNAIFRSGNLQNVISIDAHAVQNTEILFGPGAVMYGSDAIGGVMDFHTLTPRFADSTGKFLLAGNALARISTANLEKTGHIDLNIGSRKWAFLSSFSYSDYDDLRTGKNGPSFYLRPNYVVTMDGKDSVLINSDSSLQLGSAFSQISLMQKIRYQANAHWSLDYGFYYSATSDAGRYDRLVLDANDNGVPDNAVWYYGPQKWMMNRLGIIHTRHTRLYDQLRIVVAQQLYEESRHDRRFNSSRIRHQYESVDIGSVNLDMDKKLSEKITLFYGAELVHNLIRSEANRQHIVTGTVEPTTTRYPNGSIWQSAGIYLSGKYKMHPKWIVNAGMRYSYYIIRAEFDTTLLPFPFLTAENKNGAFNGSLGAIFSPLPQWQLYLNAATGFRAPNLDDMGKVFESQPGSVIVPNDQLTPEYAYNLEFGTAFTLGRHLKLDIATYYTWLDNAMARRSFQYNGQDSIMYDGQWSEVLAVQNISSAYVYGIQSGIEVSFGKGWGLKSRISWQKGREQSDDSLIYYPKPHVTPIFGSTHFIYKRRKLEVDLYALYNGKMNYEDLPLTDRIDHYSFLKDEKDLPYSPAWATLNFKTAYFVNQYLTLNIGVENIFNKLYRTYSSGISAPGRNLIVAVRSKF